MSPPLKLRNFVPYLVGLLGFGVGCVWFLPVQKIVAIGLEKSLGRSGVTVELGSARLGTGLGLGFSKGSLMALKAEAVRIQLPQSLTLRCERLTLAPRLWPFLIGQLQAGFECDLGQYGRLSGRADISSPWNPSAITAFVDAEALDLRILDGLSASGSFLGKVSGDLRVTDWAPSGRGLPPVSWNLRGQEVATPAVEAELLNIPGLRLGPLATKGTFAAGKLKIDELSFGSQDSPLQASWKIDFGLDARGLPVSGEWKGTLRTDPEFEKTALSDIKLSLLFGEIKKAGQRDFRKVVRGNFTSLLFNPPEG